MIVRPARQADLPAVSRLAAELVRLHHRLDPPRFLLVEPIEEPAEAALKSWFEEHKATYAAPEYRKISYIKLDPEAIADTSSTE